MADVELYIVTAQGPVAVPVPREATSVHDLFDRFPVGAYSLMRTFSKNRFLGLDDHLGRCERSMRILGWSDVVDTRLLRNALHEVVTGSPWTNSTVRFDIFHEVVRIEGREARMAIAISSFTGVPEELRRDGVRVETTHRLPRHRPLVKTSDFARRRRALAPRDRDSYERLLLDDDERILEGASSSFYAILGDELQTAGSGVLEGITRRAVLDLARKLEIPIRLERLPARELADIDGAFLTSSSRGVVPIIKVDEVRISDGTPHPIALRLMRAYDEFAERNARTALELAPIP